ncbi:MAG: hypothetical protein GY913_11635 [Proteobacteria bacterium]|nr:hypothetical protein [Pseudomonadota bacterium]MCP4917565.1 hypothetical protein [Pseudomonadota bacterium]
MTRAGWRALGIAIVLIVHSVCVLPIPSNVPDDSFDHPVAKEELARWGGILESLGYEIEPKQLGRDLLDVGQAIADKKKAFLTPFRPVLRTTGTGQAWGLFTYPNTRPNRMHISWRANSTDEWTLLYRALDPEYDWHESTFRYRRVRGVFDDNANQVRRSYSNFCDWVSRDVFEEMPEANEVRIHMVQTVVGLPHQEPDDEMKVRLVRVLKRSDAEAGAE